MTMRTEHPFVNSAFLWRIIFTVNDIPVESQVIFSKQPVVKYLEKTLPISNPNDRDTEGK